MKILNKLTRVSNKRREILLKKSMVIKEDEVYVLINKAGEAYQYGIISNGVRVNVNLTKQVVRFICNKAMNCSLEQFGQIIEEPYAIESEFISPSECMADLKRLRKLSRDFYNTVKSLNKCDEENVLLIKDELVYTNM